MSSRASGDIVMRATAAAWGHCSTARRSPMTARPPPTRPRPCVHVFDLLASPVGYVGGSEQQLQWSADGPVLKCDQGDVIYVFNAP